MRRFLTVLLVAAAAACDRPANPVAPDAEPQRPSFSASIGEVSQDATPEQMAVAQVVPGFGGYYIDESGYPTVWLTDTSRRPEAEQALAGFLASRGFSSAELRVRQARFDYLQLDAWYRQAWPKALASPGAVYSDLDEASNRLRFGGLDAGAAQTILSAVLQLGVPVEAVLTEVTAPIRKVATLQDRVRPTPGGYQINFFASPVSPVGYVCTLGFNVVPLGYDGSRGANSFITNSHCSDVQGGHEIPTQYYQANRGLIADPNNHIGFEVDDPHYWVSLDCPVPGFRCRYSDALRAEYNAGIEFQVGYIARANQLNPSAIDLTVDGSNPTFRLVAEQPRPVVGETANKVGRTTGWTAGAVTQTCINSIVLGENIIQLCQARVEAGVDGGDSGSPVFRLGADGHATLLGILWGGSVSGTPSFVFSPLENVKRELGDFEATHPLPDHTDPRKPGKGKNK